MPRAIALSVTVDGVLQPTPAQFAVIQAQAVRQFGAMGYVIVTDLSLAEQILRINFVPNPNDPENSGRATVLGFRSNPYYASAPSNIARPYPASFGFAGMFGNYGHSYGAFNQYGYGYFGYGSSYYDGYSYSSTTLNPVTPPSTKPTHPPHRHDPAYCPPDTPRVQAAFGRFAGSYQTTNAATYPQSGSRRRDYDGPSSGSISSWFGGSRSSSGSDSGSSYSRSESSYQRSEPTSSQSAPSYASSYSAPAPSYSSSDSSFSSSSASSSSSSSSSSGSSSGSSGTYESSNQHPH